MNQLTEEQIRQNAAAYVAAKMGKPWEWYDALAQRWKPAHGAEITTTLYANYLCRPAPEPEPPKPWDCPEDLENLGPVIWVRRCTGGWPCLVTEIRDDGIHIGNGSTIIRWSTLKHDSYSTDRNTWKPCTKV